MSVPVWDRGVHHGVPAHGGVGAGLDWYPLALGSWTVVGLLAAQGIRPTTRWLLILEAAAVAVILDLKVVIVYRIGASSAPRGQAFFAEVFRLPDGVGLLVLAATFGFLAFAGSSRPARSARRRRHHADRSLGRWCRRSWLVGSSASSAL